eukprot:3179517-Amphidinium_carterae.2
MALCKHQRATSPTKPWYRFSSRRKLTRNWAASMQVLMRPPPHQKKTATSPRPRLDCLHSFHTAI